MKTLRLILIAGVLLGFVAAQTANAQYNNARRYVTPRLPQAQAPVNPRAQVRTNAPARQPAPAAPAPSAPSATAQTQNTGPTVVVRTQAMVRVVQPPVDPEKARVAKEAAVRKTVEFQKKRADEGSESAQYELGVRYLKGDGVEKDEALGRKWLAESAKNGYGPAAKKLEDLDKPPAPPKEEPASPASKTAEHSSQH